MDPLHITEFASDRYFNKLKQLKPNESNGDFSTEPATAESVALPPSLQAPTFTLPLGNPRQRRTEDELPPLKRSEQKKRSLGHDLTSLRTQRRPSFTGSFGRLHSKVNVVQKTPTIVEQREYITAACEGSSSSGLSLGDLFLALPNELQEHIIAPLPIHDLLKVRLVSKSFHTLVVLNENPIARYHVANTLPSYAMRLYPPPLPTEINLHYVCSIWHRLHVASKLSQMIARYAVKDIFLRNTPAQLLEFEPQHKRMRKRLMPLVFTLFHFFETYRNLHVQHLAQNGNPLNRQAFTLNPIEVQVMNMYDDYTLLKAHQVWSLTISSFNRRLRPPSYVGGLERAIKGYLKDRPADEVYTTILAIGGFRQAERFWETKGYNARRAAVDTWYGYVTKIPVEAAPKSKISRITHLGRKKQAPVADVPASEAAALHDATSCKEWFCVKPTCQAARRRHSTDNLVFYSSLAAGPPMSPLSRQQLGLLLPDLQHLTNIWIHTAEALIVERKIVESHLKLKKPTQVLLELIQDDGTDGIDEWSSGNPQAEHMQPLERVGSSGDVSD